MNLVGTQFGEQLPAAQLDWIIADEKECIVVECMVDGLHVYDNPAGGADQQSAISAGDVFIEPVYAYFPEAAGQYVLRAASIGAAQPRDGSVGTAGEIFLPHRVLPAWRLPDCMLCPESPRRKVSVSFSTF